MTANEQLRYTGSTATFQKVDFPYEKRLRIEDVEPLIVPPIKNKPDVELLRTIRDRVDKRLAEATEAFIVGWIMPTTDQDHINRIAQIVSQSDSQLSRITIINENLSHSEIQRIAQTFARRTPVASTHQTKGRAL